MTIIPHETCPCNQRDESRDPDALMQQASDDRFLFIMGFHTDSPGRVFVQDMVKRGYPQTVALRIAGRGFGVGQ